MEDTRRGERERGELLREEGKVVVVVVGEIERSLRRWRSDDNTSSLKFLFRRNS